MEFDVPEMSCGHCKAAIETALSAADPAATTNVDLAARRVRVESSVGPEILTEAMRKAGYEAKLLA